MQRHLLRTSCVLAAGMAIGIFALPAGADGELGAESGPRSIRFKGTVKAVDVRTGRFLVPVRQGRDGDPAPRTVDVLVITAGGTRFITPPAEGRATRPARVQDLATGTVVNVSGTVSRDGSVIAQEVTLFRKVSGTEGDGGRRSSPEADAPRYSAPEAVRRDVESAPPGARDGQAPRTGPSDRDSRRDGGTRDTGRPGAEAQQGGWLAGRVKAIDAQQNTFLLEWRVTKGGTLHPVRGVVAIGANTRISSAAARREGDGDVNLTFRDLQVGAIVHVRGAETANGIAAAEIRVFPTKGAAQRPQADREGSGARTESESRRSPQAERAR